MIMNAFLLRIVEFVSQCSFTTAFNFDFVLLREGRKDWWEGPSYGTLCLARVKLGLAYI